jgi:hypothetical protein
MSDDRYSELDDKGQRLLNEYEQAREAEQRWKTRKEDLAGEIAAALRTAGANKGTIGGQHAVTVVTATSFDEDRLRREAPEVHQQFIFDVPTFDKGALRRASPDLYASYTKETRTYLRLPDSPPPSW